MIENPDKIMIARAVISKIENEGAPGKIEAHDLNDYETPRKISLNNQSNGYIPDLAVYYNNDNVMNLYEIELGDNIDIEKWRLMSSKARKNKGCLFLVIPDNLRERVKNELKSNGINAGIIYFKEGKQ